MDHPVGAVGLERMADFAGRQIARGVALPTLALTAHLADFHAAVTLINRPECRARLYCLQLLRIANQHHLCASSGSTGQHAFELARADHACLVDDQHIAGSERVASLFPTMLQAGNGARRNARSAFEVFRRNTGQRHAPDLVACCLPGLPRHPQHRALSRPGMADNDTEIAPVRDMRQCLGLLARKHQAARFRSRQSGSAVHVANLMALPFRHPFSSPV